MKKFLWPIALFLAGCYNYEIAPEEDYEGTWTLTGLYLEDQDGRDLSDYLYYSTPSAVDLALNSDGTYQVEWENVNYLPFLDPLYYGRDGTDNTGTGIWEVTEFYSHLHFDRGSHDGVGELLDSESNQLFLRVEGYWYSMSYLFYQLGYDYGLELANNCNNTDLWDDAYFYGSVYGYYEAYFYNAPTDDGYSEDAIFNYSEGLIDGFFEAYLDNNGFDFYDGFNAGYLDIYPVGTDLAAQFASDEYYQNAEFYFDKTN